MKTIGDWLEDAELAYLEIDGLKFTYHDKKLFFIGRD